MPASRLRPTPDEDSAARHRADARRVCDRLHRIASRLPPDGPARPGELTVRLTGPDVWQGAALFIGMAATAVARQLESEGDVPGAADLGWFRDGMARILRAGAPAARPGARDAGRSPCHALGAKEDHPSTPGAWASRTSEWVEAAKRVGAHAPRVRYRRHDLHVALGWWESFGGAATAWVCQQEDWRYRWTDDGRRRLAFMTACWDAYSRCDFTPEDMAIGLADMPLTGAVRA